MVLSCWLVLLVGGFMEERDAVGRRRDIDDNCDSFSGKGSSVKFIL
jgi:hypothetical protein